MSELTRPTDKDLWNAGCITRSQLDQWSEDDFAKHAAGMHNTAKMLLGWIDSATTLRPIAEYHEDMGDMLWWCVEEVPASLGVPGREKKLRLKGEAPYVGTPNDLGHEVRIDVEIRTPYPDHNGKRRDGERMACNPATRVIRTGGWPGYHTHFTPLPIPQVPK